MSSKVFIIEVEEKIPTDLSTDDLILWSVNNVRKNFLGTTSFINKMPVFYIYKSTSFGVSHRWGDYLQFIHDANKHDNIEVDKQVIKTSYIP